MKVPSISVIIPTYNRAKLLRRAIDSVLHQTFTDLELIVVDDGSDDDTSDVLKSYVDRIKVVRQQNRGTAAARNAGIFVAQADLIAFLDSDDYWLESKLQRQLRLVADRRVVLSATNWVFEDADSRPAYAEAERSQIEYIGEPLDFLCRSGGHRILPSTILVRRSIFDRIGWFDVRLRSAGEDTRFLFRSAFEGSFAIESSVCVVRRATVDSPKETRLGDIDYDRRSMFAGLEILSEAYFRAMTKPRETRRGVRRLLSGFLHSSAKQAALHGDYLLARSHFLLALLAGIRGKRFFLAVAGLFFPSIVGSRQRNYYGSTHSNRTGGGAADHGTIS